MRGAQLALSDGVGIGRSSEDDAGPLTSRTAPKASCALHTLTAERTRECVCDVSGMLAYALSRPHTLATRTCRLQKALRTRTFSYKKDDGKQAEARYACTHAHTENSSENSLRSLAGENQKVYKNLNNKRLGNTL